MIGASTAPEAVAGAQAIFSVVTADQAHEAAVAALPGVAQGAFFFDCDSCAPQTKERTAREVDAAGGRYVDVAVMAPVHPRLHRTPLLISGPHAEAAAPVLASLGMVAEIHDGPVGSSSAIKMIRSIMMKGLEALVCECVLAGRKAGVIETVLDSLDDTYPGFDWRRRSAYMLERVMTHGVRRAAEMREVALTVDLLGLDGAMSRASVGWQQAVGDLGLRSTAEEAADYRTLADKILARLDEKGGAERSLLRSSASRSERLTSPPAAMNEKTRIALTGGGSMISKGLDGGGRSRERCSSAAPALADDNTVTVGLILPMTGQQASTGKQERAGAELYIKQHGDTVAGKKIVLLVKDDTGAADVTKRLAEELVGNDHANVLMGFGLTPLALAAAPVATEAKVPEIVTAAATAMITEKSPYIVRTSFTLPQASAPMAEWALKNGIKKVVTIVTDYGPGVDAEKWFSDTFEKGGGTIAEKIRVPLKNPDFAPFLQRVKDDEPDAVFVFVPSGQGAIFMKEFVERGLDKSGIKLIGTGDVTDDDLLADIGDSALGAVTTHHYSADHDSPENKAFVAALREGQQRHAAEFHGGRRL